MWYNFNQPSQSLLNVGGLRFEDFRRERACYLTKHLKLKDTTTRNHRFTTYFTTIDTLYTSWGRPSTHQSQTSRFLGRVPYPLSLHALQWERDDFHINIVQYCT